MIINWKNYGSADFYDELISPSGLPRAHARQLSKYLKSLSSEDLLERKAASDLAITIMGVSYTVYNEQKRVEKIWSFDIIPRIINIKQWDVLQTGLTQRVNALNLFIGDIYSEQKILKDGVVPRFLIEGSKNFRKQSMGVKPPLGIWAHICGSDVIRDKNGQYYVLEDNLRVPSGISYMLENRLVSKKIFPDLFELYQIQPVDDYPSQLFDPLACVSPQPEEYPEVVVLTPGIYNSAYFEHAYLAQQMGVELVEGRDLIVADDDCVYMRTIDGLEKIDVIYRRIDDIFLDPEVFYKDSTLGVNGLMRAWEKGNVTLANAPGCGVADDKVLYAFVPDIIKYYLGEDAILNNVPTYLCYRDKDREHVLQNLDKLVVKPANEAGGYGMLIGPKSSKKNRAAMAKMIKKNPREYVAQAMISLSTAPTLVGETLEPRHIDLRPFILSGQQTYVTAGGLTRVALKKNSIVVNSSQGGGGKDTWIVDLKGK